MIYFQRVSHHGNNNEQNGHKTCSFCENPCHPFRILSLRLTDTIYSSSIFLHVSTCDYYVMIKTRWGFPGGSSGKEPACQCRGRKRQGFDPWVGKIPLEEGMATRSSILAWRIPWTEKPGGLWCIGLQRVRHDWSSLTRTHARKKMMLFPNQPNPIVGPS